jgi:tetratricopeptide (TPR) repeat protein
VPLAKAIEAAVPFVGKSFRDQPLVEARLRLTLGRSFIWLGEYRKAAEQYEAARALCLQHLGPDHLDTFKSIDGLTISYLKLGRPDDALKLCEETLPRRKAALGADDGDTLSSMRLLGWCYVDLGRADDAVKVYEEALPLHNAKLGPDHRDTLACMGNMAVFYCNLGRHADALEMQRETLARQKRTLGPSHPNMLHSMLNLAVYYSNVGQYADALKLHEETLAIEKDKLPPDHPETLLSMMRLASCYADTGQYGEALKLFEETLVRQRAKLGPDHPDTARTTHFLAWTLATAADAKFRDPPRAVELAEKGVKASPSNATHWRTLGTARYRTGNWKGAIADLEKAVGLRGSDNPNAATDGFFLAMAHWQLGEKEKAREWFDKSVQRMDRTTPENSELKRFRAEAAALLGIEPRK